MTVRDLCQRFDVADIAGGIADGFGKHRLGVFVDQFLDRISLVAVGETGRDALARQHVAEQRVRRAIKLRHGNDVAAGVGEVDKRKMQRRLAGRDRERSDAAFELGDALFKHRRGRIGDPGVAKAFRFEIEQSGTVIGAVEGIGHGLVDRNGDRLGRWIGVVAGVNCDRFVAHCSPHRAHLVVRFFARVFVRGEPSSEQQFAQRLRK